MLLLANMPKLIVLHSNNCHKHLDQFQPTVIYFFMTVLPLRCVDVNVCAVNLSVVFKTTRVV